MHLHGQQFSGVFDKFSCNSSFVWLKMQKKNNFEDKCLFSKIFYQIKMQAATNWSSHLKTHQTFELFQTTKPSLVVHVYCL